MTIIGEINPERIFEYIKLKDVPNTPEAYLMFFVMVFLIGLVVLTWRYVINYRDQEERLLWKDETWITKITFSVIVGLFSYIGAFALLSLFDSITLFFIGQMTFNLQFFDISGMVVAMLYGISFLFVLSTRKITHFKDIQYFIVANFFIIPLIVPLTMFFAVAGKSLAVAFIGLALIIPLLAVMWPIFIFLSKKRKVDIKHEDLELKEFIIEAKRNTYAKGIKSKKLKDKTEEIIYKKGKYFYRDRYFGSNPFVGEEVIFANLKPIWSMNYYGKAFSNKIPIKEIYAFLRKAMMELEPDRPFRGPNYFRDGKFEYKDNSNGNTTFFRGNEAIYYNGDLVYVLNYHGGKIEDDNLETDG